MERNVNMLKKCEREKQISSENPKNMTQKYITINLKETK